MARIYNTNELYPGLCVSLEEMQAHYLTRVMRLSIGGKFKIFNETYGEFNAEISKILKKNITVLIGDKLKEPHKVKPLTLLFAPIKNPSPTFLVQKATELGVSTIIPILTERTIVRSLNKSKLMLAAIEAAEQCERFCIPEIFDITPLEKVLNLKPFTGKLIFCDESKDISTQIVSVLNEIKTQDNAILIGPEGGFTQKDIDLIKKFSFTIPVTLGSRILRAETAIIAALSIYQAIKGNNG